MLKPEEPPHLSSLFSLSMRGMPREEPLKARNLLMGERASLMELLQATERDSHERL
jgi:hypothetical protein